MNPKPKPPPCPSWQEPRRLASNDRIWILTDVETYDSAMYHWASEQTWFKVGAYDFRTGCIGFFRFSKDDARGLLRAGISPPPWTSPQQRGFEVTRVAHHDDEEKGRFIVTMETFDIPSPLQAIVPAAERAFWHAPFTPNATPGMWGNLAAFVAMEKKIESVALGMVGWFSAGSVKALVGVGTNVSPVLKRLVDEERLHRVGKTRGTRYLVR